MPRTSPSPHNSVAEVTQNYKNHKEATDHGDEHVPSKEMPDKVPDTIKQDIESNSKQNFDDMKTEHPQNGDVICGISVDTTSTVKLTKIGSESTSQDTSKAMLSEKAAATSSTCILL